MESRASEDVRSPDAPAMVQEEVSAAPSSGTPAVTCSLPNLQLVHGRRRRDFITHIVASPFTAVSGERRIQTYPYHAFVDTEV